MGVIVRNVQSILYNFIFVGQNSGLVCYGDVPKGYDAFEQGDVGNGRARHPKQCEKMCSTMRNGCNAFTFDGYFCWFKKLDSYTISKTNQKTQFYYCLNEITSNSGLTTKKVKPSKINVT